MSTARSRYLRFKTQQWADWNRVERDRAELPFIRALITRNPRPARRSVGDFLWFFIAERFYAARLQSGFMDRAYMLFRSRPSSLEMSMAGDRLLHERREKRSAVLGRRCMDRDALRDRYF